MFGGTFCVPPSPTAVDLALGHIGHAQISRQDEKVAPAVFENCREIQLLMREMRKAQKNARQCRQWMDAAKTNQT